ncbi:hypothetical protein SC127_08790 [Pantoea sp. T14]|jgi:hypothetical protein|uniref:hypothetical protein n=1 Tax=Pantoea sp. T14 TaxID=3085685 RepID=UPI002FC84A7F
MGRAECHFHSTLRNNENYRYPTDFALQEGGKLIQPQALTLVSDWGEVVQPTHRRREVCRVYDDQLYKMQHIWQVN